MDSLLRLVDDLPTLETAWEREPFVSTGLGDLGDVFSLETAERLIHSSLPMSAVRLFRDGELVPPELVLRNRGSNPRSREKLADGTKVAEQVAGGATLTLEELQNHSPEVARFAAEVARETGYEADCTAFLTPPRARGAAPHFDLVGIFLRQLHGSKRWRVSAPVRRLPSRARPVAPSEVGEPVLDVVLKEGECLYLPRGFVHVGDTTDEPSLHLSIGLRGVTWERVLRSLLAGAGERFEPLREVLPPAFSDLDREALYRERVELLAKHLADADWSRISLDGLRAEQPPAAPAPGSLAASLRRPAAAEPAPEAAEPPPAA
ncbi:cupin domain-containing protein [Kitasatospora sp. NBC_01246]|uniref:JmjC domain-containing protein n=1 Tax=Kitasatospora sp. NBC_01246 TaxID=2903570 RepID=UPI002E3507A6|nr:cupin domain-containing protein [Kitasatospora sp. NBC_01246]